MTDQYQSVSGAVDTSTTPVVQYACGDLDTGSRLTEMDYPNGRKLHYGYDGNALDEAIGRVDYLADDNGSGGVGDHDVDYSYLGLSTIVGRAQEQRHRRGNNAEYLRRGWRDQIRQDFLGHHNR